MVADRNQYLRQMGIDVWVLREDGGLSGQPVGTAAALPATDTASSPRFHLCLATYDDLSLIFEVPFEAATLPAELRRLADDIALACGRSRKPAVQSLRWPMVKSPGFDQSASMARTALAERVASCGPFRLVFGKSVLAWLADGDIRVADEIGDYLKQPLRKRQLYGVLKEWLS